MSENLNFTICTEDTPEKELRTYPNLSICMGGDEGGVCMGPAMFAMPKGEGVPQCC